MSQFLNKHPFISLFMLLIIAGIVHHFIVAAAGEEKEFLKPEPEPIKMPENVIPFIPSTFNL